MSHHFCERPMQKLVTFRFAPEPHHIQGLGKIVDNHKTIFDNKYVFGILFVTGWIFSTWIIVQYNTLFSAILISNKQHNVLYSIWNLLAGLSLFIFLPPLLSGLFIALLVVIQKSLKKRHNKNCVKCNSNNLEYLEGEIFNEIFSDGNTAQHRQFIEPKFLAAQFVSFSKCKRCNTIVRFVHEIDTKPSMKSAVFHADEYRND